MDGWFGERREGKKGHTAGSLCRHLQYWMSVFYNIKQTEQFKRIRTRVRSIQGTGVAYTVT